MKKILLITVILIGVSAFVISFFNIVIALYFMAFPAGFGIRCALEFLLNENSL